MVTTTVPPTTDGVYWWREIGEKDWGYILIDGRLGYVFGAEPPIVLSSLEKGLFEWCGPIPDPENIEGQGRKG